ncbi:uncharacterized protein NDAI_0G04590 [Naumovozyma dairenensis CBS 421]|uniref:Mitochondrial resolvase Ydc2 catalytic domain-containing protein n=1 Tax=Naumovozyma dairenensis (strain ATCC 10597 / BCRC 20456 / CBS 421 / NBRC 0211 / NRRL Y-12639) TaxID=1071378 RepID=J7REB8_NAUDC|nr:hypothetical protein NDAI_0G04590 [Naumovozyma dairenensis CBS 421]CCK73444.1 hypothetical protein NDAI_0G04590 [Naumovozyma dairenensis CBS 421]
MKFALKKRSSIDALDMYCKKASKRTLKFLSIALGSKHIDIEHKSDIRSNIINHCEILEAARRKLIQKNQIIISSIHLGVKTFTISKFKIELLDENNNKNTDDNIEKQLTVSKPILLDWDKLKLEELFLPDNRSKITLHPTDMTDSIFKLSQYLTTEKENRADLFTIGRPKDTYRLSSKPNSFENVLKINLFEQLLYSTLKNKLSYLNLKQPQTKNNDDAYLPIISDTKLVSQFWCNLTPVRSILNKSFGKGSDESNLQLKSPILLNSIKMHLVRRIIESALQIDNSSNKVTLTPNWEHRLRTYITEDTLGTYTFSECLGFLGRQRECDNRELANVFLQGLSWMEWLQTYIEIENIVTSEKGNYTDEILNQFNAYCHYKKNKIQEFQKGTSPRLTSLENYHDDYDNAPYPNNNNNRNNGERKRKFTPYTQYITGEDKDGSMEDPWIDKIKT